MVMALSRADWVSQAAGVVNSLEANTSVHFVILGDAWIRKAVEKGIRPSLRSRICFSGGVEQALQALPAVLAPQSLLLIAGDSADPLYRSFEDLLGRFGREFKVLLRTDVPLAFSSAVSADKVDSPDLTFVLQGPLIPEARGTFGTRSTIKSIRLHFPGSKILLSTWRGSRVDDDLVDRVVYSDDPGPLPPLKRIDAKLNNANRQIVSTLAGLRAVETPLAVKIRTDAVLCGTGFYEKFVKYNQTLNAPDIFRSRVLVLQFYTMSMRGIEKMPYHISDIFQMGCIEDLLSIWDRELMTLDEAIYFQRRPHLAANKSFQKFNAKLAVEQFIHAPLAGIEKNLSGEDLLTAEHEARHNELLARQFIVSDYATSGLVMQKFEPSFVTRGQQLNCMGEREWLSLALGDAGLDNRGWRDRLSAWNHRRKGL
jgi:WavE lipopolysaccharide synthesis